MMFCIDIIQGGILVIFLWYDQLKCSAAYRVCNLIIVELASLSFIVDLSMLTMNQGVG